MKVKLEFVIEKVAKLGNNQVEIIALGIANDTVVQPSSPESMMLIQIIPPELREMLNQQSKMMRDREKPFIRFIITENEYSEGNWKVGDILSIDIMEVIK